MTVNRHEAFEELISASLTGDLTATERQRLDTHLDSCDACRATLAAFADQRRIMAGLRHVAPPRDLGARVRTGIERGAFVDIPWWRRPAVIFAGVGGSLAAVAGALLAIVILNGSPPHREVGQPSLTASMAAAEPSETARPTLPPIAAPTPNASPAEGIEPTAAPSATQIPSVETPEPAIAMAVTGPAEDLSVSVVEGSTGDKVIDVEAPEEDPAGEPVGPLGPPIVAELSPDGQWLAFITEMGQSGQNEVWATRLSEAPEPTDADASPPVDSTAAVGQTVHLGVSVAGSPFLERLAWSPDGAHLAYTLMDPDAGEEADEVNSDVWVFDTAEATIRRLTESGTAYAASFMPAGEDDAMTRLWISNAGDEPVSTLHELPADAAPMDPGDEPVAVAEGIFQPLVSPNGALAIFWSGQMATDRDHGWVFAVDGAPQLAELDVEDGTYAFVNDRPVFTDLPSRGNLFRSAAITWSLDGNAYAIWHTDWLGETSPEAPYPDPNRVYLGRATDRDGMTRDHALDRADVAEGMAVVDVEVAPTGTHLLVTARERSSGVLDAPRAELRLITRNLGDVADDFEVLDVARDGWAGPAVFQPDPESNSSQAP
ncbi:MAG: zf-HC2 domain-containing protein [Chloroflexota bacterium]|nr:zf-HC2 domain-containing protein [Chloroflexota bacterium]